MNMPLGWQEIGGVVGLAVIVIYMLFRFLIRVYTDSKNLSFAVADMLKNNAKKDEEFLKFMHNISESIKTNSERVLKVDSNVDSLSRLMIEMFTSKNKKK